MGIPSSGRQLSESEHLEHPNTSCADTKVIAVKVEEDYTNMVNTALFLMQAVGEKKKKEMDLIMCILIVWHLFT